MSTSLLALISRHNKDVLEAATLLIELAARGSTGYSFKKRIIFASPYYATKETLSLRGWGTLRDERELARGAEISLL
jgi:hypothetical protein